MGKYYEGYKSLHEEVKKAVGCPKCSDLKGKIDSISTKLQGLDLDWDDTVKSGFDTYISDCVSILTTISSSVGSDFQSAENAYNSLLPILDNFEKDDKTYDKLLQNKPSETITSTLKDGSTEVVTSPLYIEWKGKKRDLEQAFNDYIIKIQPYKRTLTEVGGKTIAAVVTNAGIQSGGSIVFTMPQDAYTDTGTDIGTYSSNLEKYLSSISNDPSKCAKVVDLRSVIPQLGTTSEHTFMGWQKVTDKTSDQYSLRETVYPDYDKHSSAYYDSEGFARIGDRYVVATTTTYGNVGDYIDIEQKDGSVIKAVIGDIKNQNDKGCNQWGHDDGKCVVEFVVDCNSWYYENWSDGGNHANPGTPSCHPEWHQDVVEIRNLGNYFDLKNQFANV